MTKYYCKKCGKVWDLRDKEFNLDFRKNRCPRCHVYLYKVGENDSKRKKG